MPASRFNVFCAEQMRSHDAVASMRPRRRAPPPLRLCRRVQRHPVEHAMNSEVAAQRRAWRRERSGRHRFCQVRHDQRRIEVSVL